MAAETAEQREARLQRDRDQWRSRLRRAVETAIMLHVCCTIAMVGTSCQDDRWWLVDSATTCMS